MGLDQIVYLHDLPHDGGVEALGELDQSGIEKTLQSCWEWEACRRRQVVSTLTYHEIVFHEVENEIEGALVFPGSFFYEKQIFG